jgi:hypothetical protein
MVQMQKQEGEFLFEGTSDIFSDYVNNGEVIKREIQPTTVNKTTLSADGVDSIVFSNVPNGTFSAINLNNMDIQVFGSVVGEDTFSTTISGTYSIKIESFPYLDFEITVEAI